VNESARPNVVLRGGPQPVGPRHLHIAAHGDEVRWHAADGSGLHRWARTGQHEEHGDGLLRVYAYAGPAEPDSDLDSA
jgi:hypothetical protein